MKNKMAEGGQIEVSVGRTEGSLDVCKNVPSHLSAAKGEMKGSQQTFKSQAVGTRHI